MGLRHWRSSASRAVPRRSRYFAFRDTREERRELQAAISGLIKPYPKRPRSALGLDRVAAQGCPVQPGGLPVGWLWGELWGLRLIPWNCP